MIKSIKNIRLRNKMLLVILLTVLLVLFAEIASRQFIYEAYNEQLYLKTAQVLTAFSNEVETQIERIENVTLTMIGDSTIQGNLMMNRDSVYGSNDWIAANRNLAVRFSYYKLQGACMADFMVVASNHLAFNAEAFAQEKQKKYAERAHLANGQMVLIPEEGSLCFAREIRQTQNLELSTLGYIIGRVDFNALVRDCSKTFERIGVPINVSIYSEDYHIFNDSPKAVEAKKEKNGWQIINDDFVVVYTSSTMGLTFVVSTDYAEIRRTIFESDIRSSIIVVIAVVIAMLIAMWMLNGSIQELIELTKRMDAMGSGLLPEKGDFYRYKGRKDEIGRLYRHFYRMSQDYQQLTDEYYKSELLLKDAQYKQLQNQIQPHFLFNTLATIFGMAYANHDDKVANIVEHLANMLRVSIREKESLVTVEKDMQMVRDYLYIQQIRYGDRLQVEIDLSEIFNNLLIPAVTIQPLVENSICYALEEMLEPCRIQIYGVCLEQETQIIVQDNGPGISPEKFAKVLDNDVETNGNGIGLRNIHQRLQLAFSQKCGLSVNRDKQWAQVIIHLPGISEGKNSV